MKATSLLVCLVLPSAIVGFNIVASQQPWPRNANTQYLDLIDQYPNEINRKNSASSEHRSSQQQSQQSSSSSEEDRKNEQFVQQQPNNRPTASYEQEQQRSNKLIQQQQQYNRLNSYAQQQQKNRKLFSQQSSNEQPQQKNKRFIQEQQPSHPSASLEQDSADKHASRQQSSQQESTSQENQSSNSQQQPNKHQQSSYRQNENSMEVTHPQHMNSESESSESARIYKKSNQMKNYRTQSQSYEPSNISASKFQKRQQKQDSKKNTKSQKNTYRQKATYQDSQSESQETNMRYVERKQPRQYEDTREQYENNLVRSLYHPIARSAESRNEDSQSDEQNVRGKSNKQSQDKKNKKQYKGGKTHQESDSNSVSNERAEQYKKNMKHYKTEKDHQDSESNEYAEQYKKNKKQYKKYNRYQEKQAQQYTRYTRSKSSDSHSSESSDSQSEEYQNTRYNMNTDYPQNYYQNPNNGFLVRKHIVIPYYGKPVVQKNMYYDYENPTTNKDYDMIYKDGFKAMRKVSDEEKLQFNEEYDRADKQEHEQNPNPQNATQMIQSNKYPVEQHTVKTEDGYLLTVLRIPATQDSRIVQKKPVVFLMHGLLGSADDWLLMGKGKSLAYLLADAGYDVWLGNARGSKYSRRHVSIHSALPKFWDYSNDEIAQYDLPAMIDYALHTSQQKKMFYVGFGEANAQFFAMSSTKPEYNNKIIMMHALSPVAYMANTPSPFLKMIAPNSPFYYIIRQLLPEGEFQPSRRLLKMAGSTGLEKVTGSKKLSGNINYVMSGVSMQQLNASLAPVIVRHLPSGASVRQIMQVGQAVASQDFRMYDHGPEMNVAVYGSRQPPKYDMSKVSVRVALYSSEQDWLASPQDVQRLESELPNVIVKERLPAERNFSNMDYQFGMQAPEYVYQRVIASIQKDTTTSQ